MTEGSRCRFGLLCSPLLIIISTIAIMTNIIITVIIIMITTIFHRGKSIPKSNLHIFVSNQIKIPWMCLVTILQTFAGFRFRCLLKMENDFGLFALFCKIFSSHFYGAGRVGGSRLPCYVFCICMLT